MRQWQASQARTYFFFLGNPWRRDGCRVVDAFRRSCQSDLRLEEDRVVGSGAAVRQGRGRSSGQGGGAFASLRTARPDDSGFVRFRQICHFRTNRGLTKIGNLAKSGKTDADHASARTGPIFKTEPGGQTWQRPGGRLVPYPHRH